MVMIVSTLYSYLKREQNSDVNLHNSMRCILRLQCLAWSVDGATLIKSRFKQNLPRR